MYNLLVNYIIIYMYKTLNNLRNIGGLVNFDINYNQGERPQFIFYTYISYDEDTKNVEYLSYSLSGFFNINVQFYELLANKAYFEDFVLFIIIVYTTIIFKIYNRFSLMSIRIIL